MVRPRGGGATHVRPAAACWQARPARRRSPRRWGRAVRRGAGRKRSGAQASTWAQPAPAGPSACGGFGASRGHGLAWIIGARRGFLDASWPGRGHRPERPQRALGRRDETAGGTTAQDGGGSRALQPPSEGPESASQESTEQRMTARKLPRSGLVQPPIMETITPMITPETAPAPAGGPGGRRIPQPVAPDRRLAIEEKALRPGRTSRATPCNGVQEHWAVDLESPVTRE